MAAFARVAERARSHRLTTTIVVGEITRIIFLPGATTIITPATPAADTQTEAIIIITAVGVIPAAEPVLRGIPQVPTPVVHLEGVDPQVVVEVLVVAVVIHAEGTNLKTSFV